MPFNENQLLSSTSAAPAVTQSVFSWWGLLGTFLFFLLILFGSLWMIRRLNQAALQRMNVSWARVLDRQVLSGQQSLYLVEVAGELQVLGGTDHHLIKISEINDPAVAAEILEEIAARPTERVGGWLERLANLWARPSRQKDPFSVELGRLFEEEDK